MAWTAPRTWVAGELVTAALMNTYIKDNQSAIVATTGAYVNAVVGPHAIGGATNDYTRLRLLGSFTSGGAGTTAYGVAVVGTITGHSADSSAIAGMNLDNSIVTAGNCTTVAQLWVAEPKITVGSGTVTNSATVYIEAAADEATNDYALWVDGGATRLDGTVTTESTVTVGTDLTVTEDLVVSGTGPHAIGGAVLDYVRLGLTGAFTSGGASTVAIGTLQDGVITGHSGDSGGLFGTRLANQFVAAGDVTGSDVVAQLFLSEPILTTGGNTIANTATLYIEGAATEATGNYALWVDVGATQLDGSLDVAGASTFNDAGADVDFRVESDDNAHMLFVDGGEDRIGVGTSVPRRTFSISTGAAKSAAITYPVNLIQTNEGSNYSQLGVYFTGAASQADRITHFQPSEDGVANTGIIEMNPDGGKFRAKQGILFGTDTAAANQLDDYEEGTFTPVLTGTTSASGVGYDTQAGIYTKVGNRVDFNVQIHLNDEGTIVGYLKITGLPFTPGTGQYKMTAGSCSQVILGDHYEAVLIVYGTATFMYCFMQAQNAAGSQQQMNATTINDTSQFYITGSYTV